jgi:hypothetical protein
MEVYVQDTPDTQGLSAAMAGFLASQVLTIRFLVDQGIVEKEKVIAYFEAAIDGMRPGIADERSLMALKGIVASLRAPADSINLQ